MLHYQRNYGDTEAICGATIHQGEGKDSTIYSNRVQCPACLRAIFNAGVEIEDVIEAMKATTTVTCWYSNDDIEPVLRAAESKGWVTRMSTTQIHWSAAGVIECKAHDFRLFPTERPAAYFIQIHAGAGADAWTGTGLHDLDGKNAVERCKELQKETGILHRVIDGTGAVVYCQPVYFPPTGFYKAKTWVAPTEAMEIGAAIHKAVLEGEVPKGWDKIEAGEESREIDLTPTWEEILPILFHSLRHGNEKGQAAAEKELTRLARIADRAIAEQKAGPSLLSALEDLLAEDDELKYPERVAAARKAIEAAKGE